MKLPRDLYTGLIAFDEGTLTYEEMVDLVQYLVDTGLAWSLPGRIGRMARDMIVDGVVKG